MLIIGTASVDNRYMLIIGRLRYLTFDLNSSCSTNLEIAGLDSSNFERDFEVAQVMLSID